MRDKCVMRPFTHSRYVFARNYSKASACLVCLIQQYVLCSLWLLSTSLDLKIWLKNIQVHAKCDIGEMCTFCTNATTLAVWWWL